jgi:putative intracellular protease/amidase
MDLELDAFLVGDTLTPVKTTGDTIGIPRYDLDGRLDMDAFLVPGEIGTRAQIPNGPLLSFTRSLPQKGILVSVWTGSWIYTKAGLLEGITNASRKQADPS